MAQIQQIVVWDSTDDFWEGSLVDDTRAGQLSARGVALLPVAPELFKRSGVGGYMKRSWGAGWPLDSIAPRVVAPLTLFCNPAHRNIHWKARLVCDASVLAKVEAGERFEGMLRLTADRGQATPFYAGFSPDPNEPVVDIRKLGKPDADGGWTVGGSGVASIPQEGHYGFALYGAAPGLRVAWVAASQT